MQLLTYVQTLNNTLGIVETGRNLLTRPGTGHPSVSALSQQIDQVGAALNADIRDARNVLQQDIATVNSMVSQVLAQQAVLRQEIHQVIEGVAGLNGLMKKHMKNVEDQLRFLVEEPIQNACYQLTAHLTNQEGVGAADEEIRAWLRTLESWISKAATRKTVTMSSDEAVQILSQSPDNIGLIASRLRLLFGDIIPEAFLSLPSVSIKFYFTVTKLYLKGLEKNPHLLGSDKAVSICQEIQNTLSTYLEFAKFLKNNSQIVQALFDQHHYQLIRNKLLAQELNTLLKSLLPVIGSKAFDEKFVALEKAASQPVALLNSNVDIWDNLPTQPHERVKRLFAVLSQDTPPTVARTKYMLLPEGAAYTPIPNTISWATHGAPDGSSTSSWGCSYFPNQPKPPAFVSVSVLFLLLAAGYADTNYFRNSTLKKQVALLIANCPPHTCAIHTGGTYQAYNFADIGVARVSGVRFDPFRSDTCYVTYRGEEYFLERNRLTTGSDAKTEYPFKSNPCIYSGHRANIFEYHAKLTDELPKEYDAILKNNAQSDINTYKILFKFYVMYSQGLIKEADTFIRQQTFTQEFEKSYFLFIVAVLGRWDIFEAFHRIHPISNYNWTFRGTTITPLMLAEQNGHADVVTGLKAKSSTQTLLGKTVATDTSDYIKALEGILNSVSTSKTTLGQYIPTPPIQQVIPPAQASSSIPDDVTDDEMEDSLEKTTSTFFSERKRHTERTHFWKKSTDRRYQHTGMRVIGRDEFADDDQFNEFFGSLQLKFFKVSRLKAEKQLLLELPPMK